MSDAKRTYKQYIKLNIEFDECQLPNEVWPKLFNAGIAVKEGGHRDYSHKNFLTLKTKTMYRITSPLSVESYDLDYFSTENRELLNAICGDLWSKERITVDNPFAGEFRPDHFGIRVDSLEGTSMSSWFSSREKDEWIDDIRCDEVGVELLNKKYMNIYSLRVKVNYESGNIKSMVFSMTLATDTQTMFTNNQPELDATVIKTLGSACDKIGSYSQSFSCNGEIEVEKAISCSRFASELPNDEELTGFGEEE